MKENNHILHIKDLHVHYSGIKALNGVSFKVGEGEMIGILGSNGAGKTTLANAVCGLIKPVSGEIYFKGKKISDQSPHTVVKQGIIQVPEGRGIFCTLTVLENLLMGGYLIKSKKKLSETLEKIFAVFPVLLNRKDQLAGNLSGGEQQMLAIGRGLMAGPQLLILDEPTLGLSPLVRKEVGRVAQKINGDGTSIILIEQDARLALKITQRAVVLQNGRIIIQGNSKELLNDSGLRESYLS